MRQFALGASYISYLCTVVYFLFVCCLSYISYLCYVAYFLLVYCRIFPICVLSVVYFLFVYSRIFPICVLSYISYLCIVVYFLFVYCRIFPICVHVFFLHVLYEQGLNGFDFNFITLYILIYAYDMLYYVWINRRTTKRSRYTWYYRRWKLKVNININE